MRVSSLLAVAICLSFAGPALSAQQHEPGTGSTRITPASKAPRQVQRPNVRLDSKPHTSIDNSVDSSQEPMDLGLGASSILDLGHDIVPVTPPGMVSRSVPGNPRMVYFSLSQRTLDDITAADRTILASRQADLAHAAAGRGFDLKQPGWVYRQAVCPAMQPDAEAVSGVPAADDGQGFLLLHFTRRGDAGRISTFTALVPRVGGRPVRVIAVARRKTESRRELLSGKTNRAAVNEALPPSTLYSNLQPVKGWIPASACIAEIDGAMPRIPNEPFLSEAIITAPAPSIRLMLNGQRKVIFTDYSAGSDHYIVWNEHVSRRGRLLQTRHNQVKVVARPVTNPPTPQPRMIADVPQPPTRIRPEPPSPLSGEKQ